MSWLLPSALVIGGLAVLAIGALHFITRTEPRPEPFPTARFVPERALRARARTLSLSDLLLLAVRAAAILALAAAVAGPLHAGARGRVSRVIALDRSRAVASAREVADSARSLARAGDVTIAFDTTAVLLAVPQGLDSLVPSTAPGSLSTALAAAIGMAARVADRADSIEIVLVSPFLADEADDATARIRETWGGRLRVVRVGAAIPQTFDPRVVTSASADDPVVAALALAGRRGNAGSVRLTRTVPSAADSAWARAAGHVLVFWPSRSMGSDSISIDTVGAVAAGDAVVVARFARFARPWALQGRAVARWVDGEPAAVERAHGDGCVRDVAIPLDPASDATLRPAFRHFLDALLVPCGGARSARALGEDAMSVLAGRGPLVATASLEPAQRTSSWTPWLLALGALLLIAELAARRARSAPA